MSDNDKESVEESHSSEEDESWIAWYCSLAGNQLFCQVDRGYISDSFNLFGLKNCIGKDFNHAIDAILSKQGPSDSDGEQGEMMQATTVLYGMIHARYIITTPGLDAMRKKYMEKDFGECPRAYCRGQAMLPVGFSDEPRHSAVKFYCPQCGDAYNAPHTYRHIDGAYFSTTFPHLFMMTFADLRPAPAHTHAPIDRYTPKIFGFKIHQPSSSSSSSSSAIISKHMDNNVQHHAIHHPHPQHDDIHNPRHHHERHIASSIKDDDHSNNDDVNQHDATMTHHINDDMMMHHIHDDHNNDDNKMMDAESITSTTRLAKRVKLS